MMPRDDSAPDSPRSETFLSSVELAQIAGISVVRVERLVRLGLLEPVSTDSNEFTTATAARLRRMLRLHAELDVNLAGAAVIVQLLERLDRLEAELAHMGRG